MQNSSSVAATTSNAPAAVAKELKFSIRYFQRNVERLIMHMERQGKKLVLDVKTAAKRGYFNVSASSANPVVVQPNESDSESSSSSCGIVKDYFNITRVVLPMLFDLKKQLLAVVSQLVNQQLEQKNKDQQIQQQVQQQIQQKQAENESLEHGSSSDMGAHVSIETMVQTEAKNSYIVLKKLLKNTTFAQLPQSENFKTDVMHFCNAVSVSQQDCDNAWQQYLQTSNKDSEKTSSNDDYGEFLDRLVSEIGCDVR